MLGHGFRNLAISAERIKPRTGNNKFRAAGLFQGRAFKRSVTASCIGERMLLNDQNVALIAQLVEHLTCNQGVRRSNRRGGTIFV